MTNKSTSKYLTNLEDRDAEKINFYKQFSNIDSELIDMLESLLQVNPYFRPSASELLRSPVFDPIRCKELEISSQDKI